MTRKALVVLKVSKQQEEYLIKQAGSECELCFKSAGELSAEDLASAEIIIGNLDPRLVHEAQALKLLQLNSAGYDPYVKPGVLNSETKLCNATGAYGLAVGEHMLALTFDLIRHLFLYRDGQHQCSWQDCGSIISVEGSTVLVLGLGDIGGSYARKMKALGAACVIGIRRSVRDKPEYLDEQYTLAELDKVLPRADLVAMVLPGDDTTANLMDLRRLRLMKKGAYLINVGRGSAIVQEDLIEVLNEGHLGGAALDVTTPEPLPKDNPLWQAKNLFITPHVAGNFFLAETLARVVRIAGQNLQAYLQGQPLINEVKH
ncbi:MAG: D-2-hydroxyacid dehydrogenase [Succinivibrio sp.]|nr:D-2-hydroxyacid dehydrogenase [Succinivibrio sp.]